VARGTTIHCTSWQLLHLPSGNSIVRAKFMLHFIILVSYNVFFVRGDVKFIFASIQKKLSILFVLKFVLSLGF
jgi:hypothetical protein